MSEELKHASVQGGWFREVSDTMWPGQAMSLRCNQILHVEKSKYQDVRKPPNWCVFFMLIGLFVLFVGLGLSI